MAPMIQPSEVFSDIRIDASDSIDQFSAEWTVPTELAYFDGHFPGNPILPAVAITDASLYVIQKRMSQMIYVQAVPMAKFMAPVAPKQDVRMNFTASEGGRVWEVEWSDKTTNTSIAKLSIQV